MDINGMEPKENVLIPVAFTYHFCMVPYMEPAASGCCAWCLGTGNIQESSLLDTQEK